MHVNSSQRVVNEAEVVLSASVDRRCRILRADGSCANHGWVEQRYADQLLVSCCQEFDPADYSADAAYVVEIAGPNSLHILAGKITGSSEKRIALRVAPRVETRPLDMASRIRVHGIKGKLSTGKKSDALNLTNMSTNGLGFTTAGNFKVGDECTFEIDSESGTIKLEAAIMHISEGEAKSFTAGAEIRSVDRVSRARWHRLLEDMQA
jgi:hypothetical protein